ncbi:hypothetical protein ICL29_004018 [Salmonella enterica]|nr:hypothetical protein [Salmonella enterica]EHK5999295.1 hypothetical protein [Salmonella enterica]EIF5124633.1 hypothetical protein [Salmonella enterica]EIF5348690.1 hypothetical protein [Salmonella enterica]EIF5657287.1 hypothetical protein [Salmonella enterica]
MKFFATLSLCLLSVSVMASSNNWNIGGGSGWREILATNDDGYTLNFTCDMGAKEGTEEHAAGRMLNLSGGAGDKAVEASTKWSIETIPSVITLKVGGDSYNIENQATAPARREWYRFWADTVKAADKTVNVFLDGKKVTAFSMEGAADIYAAAPQDGCLKKDTN